MFDFSDTFILLNQSFPDAQTAIEVVGQKLVQAGKIMPEYIASMQARQKELSVHIGNYLAIPHGENGSQQWIKEEGMAFVQVPDGVNFGSQSHPKLATLLFFVYLKDQKLAGLQEIAFLGADFTQVLALSDAQTPEEVLTILTEATL